MWTQLLWKDWRVNRIVIAGSAILIASPYATAALLEYFYPSAKGGLFVGFRQSLSMAAIMASVVTVLMAAVFGAAAFASERRERSAEFLAMLPVTRRTVVFAKLLLAGSCVAAMWLLNVAVLKALGAKDETTGALHIFGPVILMAFGVGWLFSTFLTSPGVAAGISIGGTIFSTWALAAMVSKAMEELNREYLKDVVELTVQVWTIGAGVLCLFIGTVYYLRRVEP
jgi:ABC-type transport system involved in multi-copper enzyme maturation permease subunit